MDTHLNYLHQQGFKVRAEGRQLILAPASKLTTSLRLWIKVHRSELLAELEAGDDQPRRCVWRVYLDGRFVCTMVSEPITQAEAMQAVSRWPTAEVRA
ncbi:hypothetical protein PP479_02065 [Pseudomonas aeruginosa]|uniref:hypothetical protein n=1 Tax=Pseudomonas aeruginosa TaxID=287 RepID=UPI002B263918|nr:hypothetical protein [Pseudomonas aeruginosa]WOX95347.1 hypothetical protein PP479_02065 [Pseudomonas aeruginosa]HBN8651921.1 hypothetical protein [Pseudomonas aeruginosa]HCE0322397.1 hypothetical protein [Pseudomonas aeruginosa]HCE3951681.1 hypothetical protein [Pseudomonas aeruginosa]